MVMPACQEPTVHTVQVRTVYQHVVRRGAPVPVPAVRARGPYRGVPCTAGTKGQLHRSLCVPPVPKVQLHRNLCVPSVCVKRSMIVANRRKPTQKLLL